MTKRVRRYNSRKEDPAMTLAMHGRRVIECEVFEILLPWPPSINHYYLRDWRTGRVVLGARGREYRTEARAVIGGSVRSDTWPRVSGPVSVSLVLYPPDRRRRDIDNIRKAVYDAISDRPGHVGIIADDCLIRRDSAEMTDKTGGQVLVTIERIDKNASASKLS